MEDDLQAVAVGIGENVLVELHRLLLVSSKEVDLDTFDTDALHPLHLTFTGNGCVHAVSWALWGIIPETVGVIPEHEVNTLGLGILGEFYDAVTTNLCVPEVIHEAILKAHG